MTDIEPPADLIALKRDFIKTDAELAALSKTMPSGRAIIAGEAVEDPADRVRWNALNDRLSELAVEMDRHPELVGLSQMKRYELNTKASKAARASL